MNDQEPSTARGESRREFARVVAASIAATLVPAAGKAAAEPSDPTMAVAEALTEIVRGRHGKHLTNEQLKETQRAILRGVRAGERLRQFELKNSDEPAFTFSADLP